MAGLQKFRLRAEADEPRATNIQRSANRVSGSYIGLGATQDAVEDELNLWTQSSSQMLVVGLVPHKAGGVGSLAKSMLLGHHGSGRAKPEKTIRNMHMLSISDANVLNTNCFTYTSLKKTGSSLKRLAESHYYEMFQTALGSIRHGLRTADLAKLNARLAELRAIADDEGIEWSDMAESRLRQFLNHLANPSRPAVAVDDNGDLRVLWRNLQNDQVGVRFREEKGLEAVLFSHTREGEVLRRAVRGSTAKVLQAIYTMGLDAVVSG